MDDARLKQLVEKFDVELMEEDLQHEAWVVVVASKGVGHPPEVAHGVYRSAFEALEKADTLRRQMDGAEGRQEFMAGYTPTISIVPVFGDEEEDA